ncbi:hypothetical protein J6590_050391 [Homalodisca vitripennis]|nr:hypothetical protein J6590_050391 [Homalodisca vitripennis]
MPKSYTIKRNEKVGRFVVASRDLKAGDEVLMEYPFVVGPKSGSPPVCLGCYCPTDGSVVCSACGWPVCGEECATLEPHKGSECAVFAAAGVRYQQEAEEEDTNGSPQYECITPLRMLLNKEKAPDRWQAEIDEMEAHTEERKAQSEWKTEQINVVEFLRKKCRLAERFSEDIIHFVIGVLEVNAFEVRTENGFFVRGLYPQTAIMSHNCVANTTHTIYPADNFR